MLNLVVLHLRNGKSPCCFSNNSAGGIGDFYVNQKWGTLAAWVAQSVKHPTLAEVMISWFVSSSPTAGKLGPHFGLHTFSLSLSAFHGILSLSLFLSAPRSLERSLSLSQKEIS